MWVFAGHPTCVCTMHVLTLSGLGVGWGGAQTCEGGLFGGQHGKIYEPATFWACPSRGSKRCTSTSRRSAVPPPVLPESGHLAEQGGSGGGGGRREANVQAYPQNSSPWDNARDMGAWDCLVLRRGGGGGYVGCPEICGSPTHPSICRGAGGGGGHRAWSTANLAHRHKGTCKE